MTEKITREKGREYLSAVLELYLQLPETPSRTSTDDRRRAAELLARGVELATVESAFLLATLRRLGRSPDMSPLSPIRSLAYFFPVIQEVLDNPLPDGYVEYLRSKVRLLGSRLQITKST